MEDNRSSLLGNWVGTQLTYRVRPFFAGDVTLSDESKIDLRNLQEAFDVPPAPVWYLNASHPDPSLALIFQDEKQLSRRWKVDWGSHLDKSAYRRDFVSPRAALIYQRSDWTYKFSTAEAFATQAHFSCSTAMNSPTRPIPTWFSGQPSFRAASASINGIVSDPTSAVVDGAEITLIAADTSVVRITATNGAGAYVLVNVLPATYTLKVIKEGFLSESQPPFEIFVNQTATYDFHPTIGAKQETVTLDAQAADGASSAAELGTVISEKAVNELPLNGRNFMQLLPLTPGASPISVAQNAGRRQRPRLLHWQL
ncbi:MAG: carboxypeptidase-like regulatory domain-containing protein [Bryobacteraceae bacterium]